MEIALQKSLQDGNLNLFFSQIDDLRREQSELNSKLKQLRKSRHEEECRLQLVSQELHGVEDELNKRIKLLWELKSGKSGFVKQIDDLDNKIMTSKMSSETLKKRTSEINLQHKLLEKKFGEHLERIGKICTTLENSNPTLSAHVKLLEEKVDEEKQKRELLQESMKSLPGTTENIQENLEYLISKKKELEIIVKNLEGNTI